MGEAVFAESVIDGINIKDLILNCFSSQAGLVVALMAALVWG
jgi:hypothetical protein